MIAHTCCNPTNLKKYPTYIGATSRYPIHSYKAIEMVFSSSRIWTIYLIQPISNDCSTGVFSGKQLCLSEWTGVFSGKQLAYIPFNPISYPIFIAKSIGVCPYRLCRWNRVGKFDPRALMKV